MKKIFLFFTLFVFAFLSSCDSKDNDDSQSTNFLKATINGIEVIFDIIKVERKFYSEDGGYYELEITASKSGDASKILNFTIEDQVTGTETCYFFQYTDNEVYYSIDPSSIDTSLILDITENVSNKIKGTFSGTIPEYEGSGSVEVSGGSFDIVYQIK